MSGQAFTGDLGAATRAILPSDAVTHVHLLRHGEVERMGARIVRGQLDAALSAFGVEQGERLVEWFAARVGRLDALWTSDLSRCARLAEPLGARLGVAPVLDPRLREQSMGAWEGRSWDEVSAAEPEAVGAYWSDYWNAAPSGGESLRAVQARSLEAWRDLIARHAGGRVAVVAHIGVIRGLLCALLGVDGSQALRFAPATASHTHILWSEAGAVSVRGCWPTRPRAPGRPCPSPRAPRRGASPCRVRPAPARPRWAGGSPPRWGSRTSTS
jgi:broad specificity phosphatase PhoE